MIADYQSIIRKAKKADLHNHPTLGARSEAVLANFPGARLEIPKRYFGLPGMVYFIHNHLIK